MELKLFSELYDRIQTSPSILLLGQNYLSMGGEQDAVWSKLATEYYPDLHLPLRKADYPTLWNQVVQSPRNAEELMRKIIEAGKDIPNNPAVTAITKLRWSMLYTSAIDDTEALVAARGCTAVPESEKTAHAKYLNKDRRYRVNLCGSKDAIPPVMSNARNRRAFERTMSDRISWIRNAYLEYYGVLVIDGYDPENDWLDETELFDQLAALHQRSVYWFSAPDYLGDAAHDLVEQGIMVIDHKSFFDHLLEHMPELFNSEEHDFPEGEDPALYTALTLNLDCDRTVWISRADITSITGLDRLCVITDDSLSSTTSNHKNRAQKFAEFLTQEKTPNWSLFRSKKNEPSFYVKRDSDEKIAQAVSEALKKNSSKRKPIILCGPSNSGKSMTLANLALSIAKRRKYPVIFIRGNLLSGANHRLKSFIENWFCNSERFGGERIEKIVIVWDGSGLDRTRQDYESLQADLFNCNVQVIGSLYSATRKTDIPLNQDLSYLEEQALSKLLASLGGEHLERFNEIRRNRAKIASLANSSLLYLLQMLFKYENDAEWNRVSELLIKQFEAEKDFAEAETVKSIEEYAKNFYKTQQTIAEYGVASSFQEQLRIISARMRIAAQKATSEDQKQVLKEKEVKLEAKKHLQQSVQKINGVLALASEFGIPLPLRLLLKMLRDTKGEAYISVSEETDTIVQILKNDTLLDFEYICEHHFGEEAFVSYRNPMEAENYICLLCDLPKNNRSTKRLEKEVSLLLEIIEATQTEQEIWTLLKLVRQFGPNGHGLLSEIDNAQFRKDYSVYDKYWWKIADALIRRFPEDAESVLVYAHLTREFISRANKNPDLLGVNDLKQSFLSELSYQAKTRLESTVEQIEKDGNTDSSQYNRLSIELCSTYQQHMRDKEFDPVIYQCIKERINTAFDCIQQSDSSNYRREFSSNSLLDILLNAYDAYYKYNEHKLDVESLCCEGTYMLNQIDKMLNLDDIIDDNNGWERLKKVKKVFDQQKEYSRTEELDQKLSKKNSDISIYLDARMIWRPDHPVVPAEYAKQKERILYEDHYLFVHRDTPLNFVISPELLNDAKEDAKKVIEYLESHDELVRKTKSARCTEMLLRAKWLVNTGNLMLDEKQHPALTRADWDEINDLCDRYCAYRENQSDSTDALFIPAYFLKGVYEWLYSSNPKKAFEHFEKAKTHARGSSKLISTESLVLCYEGTNIPRTFSVSVERQDNNKYVAKILRETTTRGSSKDEVVNRYNIRVPDSALKYLFNGSIPKEQRQQAQKNAAIRFNLIGPQIGNPQLGTHHGGGHSDE